MEGTKDGKMEDRKVGRNEGKMEQRKAGLKAERQD